MAKSKSRIKKQQFKRVCIFCGGSPLSEQHCIPNWIEKEFPENRISHLNFETITEYSNGELIIRPNEKLKQGRLGVKRLKIVCAKCNNHWMSIIENEAKPIVKRLVNEQKVTLTQKERESIAVWMMLVSIILENDQPDSMAVDKEEREALYNFQVPTGKWEFFLARAEEGNLDFSRRLFHQAFKIMPASDIMNGKVDHLSQKCNYQLSLLGIKQMVLISRYLRSDEVKLSDKDLASVNLIKIWPTSSNENVLINNKPIQSNIIESIMINAPEALLLRS
ncbi:hypothetical protein [Pedobacter psychrotolerans]|uniref:HNH endonuclease n=2 Tax=Pedobacter psychrotolerans TaxID=1843235 RepID=A0ABQ1SHK7_9SPHI|nr:hypothetical protein [Pedobacter psychrotolerans]GGE40402.1 hypothetical protein GCM10011413_02740 [Pedobacter psychrotolerans]